MAPNSQDPGHNDSPTNQIPLQDLSTFDGPADDRGRARASTGGSLFSRQSFLRGGSRRQYHTVAEDSPVDATAAGRNPFRQSQRADDAHVSQDDLGALAQAMSFGISFDDPHSSASMPGPSTAPGFNDSASDLDNIPLDTFPSYDHDPYNMPSGSEDDRAGLTDPRYLQPISGANNAETRRNSDTGVHFADAGRLGADLPHLENGLGRQDTKGRSRSQSLSPSASGGALQRASSLVQSMSQRVVNLSNEPEIVQQSIEREESHKSARLEGPPTLPAMADHAHDPTPQQLPPREKPSSTKMWKYRNNPFRGKSLGLLGPYNSVRLWLCDILVHPFMEPFILMIIIVQAILLIVESSKNVFNGPVAVRWGSSNIDYVFFAIFVIYTLEIGAKILVSGFILNPPEYSTLNRSLGIKKAVIEKGKNLITPHRHLTGKKVSFVQTEPQASILRTFTGMNGLDSDESYDDPLQKRRARLAHRAFLRHSFNRLDFVAVLAFWISFFLSLEGVEANRQLFIFRMLSCLRILRLLALTNGTSVRGWLMREDIVAFHLLTQWLNLGYFAKSQTSRSSTCSCCFSYRLLLASFRCRGHSKLQDKLSPNLRLD